MKKLVKVLDIRNEFRLLMELDFQLAASLNVGDIILPNGTGYAFIVKTKLVSFEGPKNSIEVESDDYTLTLNVVEFETFWDKVKRKLFCINPPHTYWGYISGSTGTSGTN